ncbi:MAG: cell envelope integrity protein CreD [Bacteroidales bacterium]|nr:cell envelope integrity protein CreD [Bacteroidales bacterium]
MNQNMRSWIRESITFKFIIISILVLLLLIPTGVIQSLIRERQQTRNEVIEEVSSKWAHDQLLIGPMISIPYFTTYVDDDKIRKYKKFAHFLPSELKIHGTVNPQIRYRSIYEVIVYSSEFSFSGYFDKPDFSKWKINEEDILYDETTIVYGLSDMRGINKVINIDFNGRSYETGPGIPSKEVFQSGISANLGKLEKEKNEFSFTIDFNGSQELSFVPMGKTTNVKLNSSWTDPSFMGAFLPDNRNIDKDGFTAEWFILELNRTYPQKWLGDAYNVTDSAFGVEFLFGVDIYHKAERSAKYAVMFLALTFLIFIMSEIINKKRIHPIQYLLIGIALSVFYVLLISLAEQIGFTWAYLIASIANITLITAYTASILNKKKITFFVALALVILYSFLFTILQLQDYALLMGSIGLFIVVAITMYLSRKIDWYGTIDQGDNP